MTRRLLASYVSLVLLVLLALEIPLGLLYSRGATDRFLAAMERDAVVLAERSEEAIEEGDSREVAPLLAQYARETGGQAVVVDSGGRLVAGTAPREQADITAALRNERRSGLTTDGDRLSVTVPAASGETIRGALQLTYPASSVGAQTLQMWLVLAGAGLAVLAVAGGVGAALARWMTRPVRELERATARLAGGTLTHPPALDQGPPELRRLAATFTTTAERLQQLITAQRSFAADASHQLKTPLTALRLRLENLEPDLDPAAHDSLAEAVAETDRLARMVQGLLALARLDNTAADRVPVDADAVIEDRAASWAPFAAEQDVTIDVRGTAVGPVQAVDGALEQVLDNLLANALRVAPPGSTLTIDRRLDGDGMAAVHVIDQGPGMSPADRRRAFDRFWRAPGSADDGSGLGLAIVERLIRASGGQISLEQAPGTGLDAGIRLRPYSRAPRTGGAHPRLTARTARHRPGRPAVSASPPGAAGAVRRR
ncbi:HAMP domain-containing sensor histidine kinase [Actinoplanes sp. NPDC049548]|uniref:sensor histidine kinase n=1 Tax=Actinoplanes sp. NPDC049548 TaxID=3155152 RepID=UPI00343053C7